MKAIRSLAVAGALLSFASAASMAQSARPFQNSWFWGLKTGGTFTSSRSSSNVTAPLAGVDWLITRNRGGIYASFDQSFLSQYATLADSVTPTDTPSRVNIKDLRRLTLAIMGYPGDWDRIHPYVGLGMVYSMVGQVKHVGTFGSSQQSDAYTQIVGAYKSAFAPTVMAGVQWDVRNFALFTQAMVWGANQQFFLSSPGRGANASLEIGIRYNFGSSIEKDR